ncbi:MAG: M23 family metallopeptidase [Paludibacteraceae bacterium]
MRFILFICLFGLPLFISLPVKAQNFVPPLRIPPSLSSNFGDLRNNHFHSGLDYRTQQTVNKPVYAADNGFVSRISVSPGGYGLALYIDHPSGYTSVYGHLNSFSKKVADYVKLKQYDQESYRVDVTLKPNEISVKKGEQIALSGNTGGSGGPHLHFEIRDTKTQDPLNVLDFLGKTMTDTQKPGIQGIAFYPQEGKGVINGSSNPIRLNIEKTKFGSYNGLGRVITAWGTVGIGIKAYDRMNGTGGTLGIESIKLFVDGIRIFSSSMSRFSFDKSRMINSFVDFEYWRNNKSFFMKSFVEPGNTLSIYETTNSGLININAEKNYDLRYELIDHYGNKTSYSFIIKGKKQAIPSRQTCEKNMSWLVSNWYANNDFKLSIPMGNLYTDICFNYKLSTSGKYYSDIHQINNKPIPLHKNALIWLKLNGRAGKDTTRYGIVEISKTGKENWIGGRYKEAGIEGSINELGGRYALVRDTIDPSVTPVSPTNWVRNRRINISLKDEKSGIAFYRGEIDGKFVLFANDVKSSIYSYIFDDSRLVKGQKHRLVFKAADGAGNKKEYRFEFN